MQAPPGKQAASRAELIEIAVGGQSHRAGRWGNKTYTAPDILGKKWVHDRSNSSGKLEDELEDARRCKSFQLV